MDRQKNKAMRPNTLKPISILIFPKAFEERNFLTCCYSSNYVIRKSSLAGLECFLIFWPIGKKCARVHSLHITQSDIQFTLKFVNFISALKKAYAEDEYVFDLILCGSCGGNKEEPGKVSYNVKGERLEGPISFTRIGDVVEIEEAVKFDRGEMWLTSEVHPSAPPCEKKYMMATKKEEPFLIAKSAAKFHSHKATAICSNYIMNIPPSKLVASLELKIPEGVRTVVDMETFDFFSVCVAFEIVHFRAIRVISDLESTVNDEIYPTSTKRLIRKNVPMDNMVRRLYHHISWFHIEDLEDLPDDETTDIMNLHSSSELNLPPIDLTQLIGDFYGARCIPNVQGHEALVYSAEEPVPGPILQ